jgi:hypothetical protein
MASRASEESKMQNAKCKMKNKRTGARWRVPVVGPLPGPDSVAAADVRPGFALKTPFATA